MGHRCSGRMMTVGLITVLRERGYIVKGFPVLRQAMRSNEMR